MPANTHSPNFSSLLDETLAKLYEVDEAKCRKVLESFASTLLETRDQRLRSYAQHKSKCATQRQPGDGFGYSWPAPNAICTCGLAALLEDPQPRKEHKTNGQPDRR